MFPLEEHRGSSSRANRVCHSSSKGSKCPKQPGVYVHFGFENGNWLHSQGTLLATRPLPAERCLLSQEQEAKLKTSSSFQWAHCLPQLAVKDHFLIRCELFLQGVGGLSNSKYNQLTLMHPNFAAFTEWRARFFQGWSEVFLRPGHSPGRTWPFLPHRHVIVTGNSLLLLWASPEADSNKKWYLCL